jgi:membrane-associated phospholipid phosphatase
MPRSSISSASLLLMLPMIMVLTTGSRCYGQAQEQESSTVTGGGVEQASDGGPQDPRYTESRPGVPLLKNLLSDQKAIWESPFHLRWTDSNWFFPMAAVGAVLFATDRAANQSVASRPRNVSTYVRFSDYGLAELAASSAGFYLLGRITHDDHRSETGVLAAEAAINTLAVTTALQYSLGREGPYQSPSAPFFHGGSSFPSNHSAVAWSIASVVAHEYPGPLTQILAYGLASAISGSRVMGEQHSPSDVFVGAAIGWFVGQYVYRAHHDPELAGTTWESLPERVRDTNESERPKASPYVSLDSWIYPALDRLISLGYIHDAYAGLKPWTRAECAEFVEEAGTQLAREVSGTTEAKRLYQTLQAEFVQDTKIASGEQNSAAQLESVYTRFTEISGPALNDSYVFGQTLINDFGRPYEQGANEISGFSGWASSGRFAVYVRGEYQHAPSAPGFSPAVEDFIAEQDETPVQPSQPVRAVSQFALLDTYALMNVDNWQLSFGKQSLWWGPAEGGALMLSDNAAPILMFRAQRTKTYELPWILSHLGPVTSDLFVGQLAGNEFPARPLMHGEKISFKPTHYFEFGVSMTTEFGGVGRPITAAAIFNSYFSLKSSDLYPPNASPGKRTIGMDFSYQVPRLRNWLTFYDDVLLPEDNPTLLDMSQSPIYAPKRVAQRPGLYLARVPGVSKLDVRVEGVYTDPPTARSVDGRYVYWNDFYHDLYTNDGNIIGDWIGRDGVGVQAWSTYWLTPRTSFELGYRHAKVDSSFIPGGETINDGSLSVNWRLPSDLTLSVFVQYEKWFAPILAPGPRTDVTSAVEVQFSPHSWGK